MSIYISTIHIYGDCCHGQVRIGDKFLQGDGDGKEQKQNTKNHEDKEKEKPPSKASIIIRIFFIHKDHRP